MAVVTTMLLVLALLGPLSHATDVDRFLQRQQRGAGDPTTTKVIESFHIKSDIRFRFATTQIVSVVRNVASFPQEIVFESALPEEAFIVAFSMTIDGKVYDGMVKEKGQAKQDYQAAVDRGESAGIVQEVPRHSKIFEISVNVAGGSVVNFTLNYQELLQRRCKFYEYTTHVKPGQVVEDFLVEVNIQENKKIIGLKGRALHSPSLLTNENQVINRIAINQRKNHQNSKVIFTPTKEWQVSEGLSVQFVVQYDVEHSPNGEILIADGYFIHFFAPDLTSLPKDIIFVLDVSGSMNGTRLAQLKTAMKVILKELKPEDKFNIITFSSDIRKWQKKPVNANIQQIEEVDKFVQGLKAGGATNIHLALKKAINELKSMSKKERAAVVFFLTDGNPTKGVKDFKEIASKIREANREGAAIFSLAFGDRVNYNSFQTISAQNSGFARKIYEASDAALQVASLYNEISSVVMKHVSISFLNNSVDHFTITVNRFPNIFKGSEVMVSGQVLNKTREFQVSIKGSQQSGEVNLILETDGISNSILDPSDPLFSGPRDFAGIVEKMWAYLTIKQLLREKDKNLIDTDKLKELDKKVIEMSLKYKFVTPLTAMVAIKPGDRKSSEIILKEEDRSSSKRDRRPQDRVTVPSFDVTDSDYLLESRVHGLTDSQQWTQDYHLSAIVTKRGAESECVIPNNLASGVYRLVTADDGYFINLEVGCAELPCNSQNALKINASSRTTSTTVDLVNMAIDLWKYSASSHLVVKQSANNLTITDEHATLSFFWPERDIKSYFNLIIKLHPGYEFSVLRGRKRNRNLKAACQSL